MMNSLIKKYNSLSLPLKATLWFTLSKFLQKGIALVTTPVFTRYLSTAEYGIVNVFYSWHDIILIFVSFNFAAGAYNNGINKFKGEEDSFTSATLGLSCVFTSVILIVYSFFCQSWDSISQLSPTLTYTMITQLILSTAMDLWSAKQRFNYEYRLLVFVSIVVSILAPILAIASFSFVTNRAYSRILSYNFVQIITYIFFFIYIFYKGKRFYSKKYWKYLLNLGAPIVPHYLSQVVLNNSDKILISLRVGTSQSGIYSVAYSAAMILNILNQSLNASLLPWMYRKLNDKKYIEIRKIFDVTLTFVGICVCLLMLFAPEFISLLAPKEYTDAVNIIPFVAGGVYFMFLSSIFINVELYYEKSKFITTASVVTAVMNLTSNFFLLPVFGYKIAGVVTLFSYLLLSILHYLFLKRYVEVNIYELINVKYILSLSFFILLFSILILFTYQYTLLRYCVIAVFLVYLYKNKTQWIELFQRKEGR